MPICRCVVCSCVQLESLARVACGICLFNAANNSSPAAVALLPPSAAAQIPQAHRLLEVIQAALHDAEMAFQHYNTSVAAVTAAAGDGRGAVGPALYCCQSVMSLKRLSADLCAGVRCCGALDEGITAALQEVMDVAQTALIALSMGQGCGARRSDILSCFCRLNSNTAVVAGLWRVMQCHCRFNCSIMLHCGIMHFHTTCTDMDRKLGACNTSVFPNHLATGLNTNSARLHL